MKKIKFTVIPLLLLIFLFTALDADAQKKKKRRPPKEDSVERTTVQSASFTDNLSYDIFLGDLFLGSDFYISSKFGVSYKVLDYLSFGVAPKFQYLFSNRPTGQDDYSAVNYGGGPFARIKIGDTFYLQGEYDFMSFGVAEQFRVSESGFLGGLGYMSGFGDWKFGLQLLFVFDNDLRDRGTGQVVEYYFGATYNF